MNYTVQGIVSIFLLINERHDEQIINAENKEYSDWIEKTDKVLDSMANVLILI